MDFRINAAIVGVSILASLLSNAIFGSNIGEVSRLNKLSFTPQNPAFSIWGIIYTLLIVFCAFVAIQGENSGISARGCMALTCTLLLTAAWVPLFSANTKISLGTASLVLWGSFGCGMWILFNEKLWTKGSVAKIIAVDTSLSLFTGWLGVASVIGTAIFFKTFDLVATRAVVLVAAASLSIMSLYLKNPVLPIGLLWATIWMEKSADIWISLSTLTITSIVSLLLTFYG